MIVETQTPNFYGLISKERAEKFDLLGQLILNQRETIILCGSDGIGKTTLLNYFKKQRENIWAICLLQGLETLNFDQIETRLISTIQQYNPELANHDLQSALSFCEQQQQKAVLMIDDAVNLTAGLISALTEYALHNPVLRVVFAFTREQLYLKNTIDSVLDDCYFMEIPALTKPQLAVFVKDCVVFSNAESESPEINEKLLNKFYQRTAGIPGKIVADFSFLIKKEQKNKLSPSLKAVLAICFIIVSVASLWVYKTIHEPVHLNLQLKPKTLPPVSIKPLIKQSHGKIDNQKNTENVNKVVALSKPLETQINQKTIKQDADEQWVLQQSAEKYTLQLMALSSKKALQNIEKKHPSLQEELKILQTKSKSREKFVLLYGSFADTKTAYLAVRLLPAEFKQAWPRQIRTLQYEVKKRTALLLNPNQSPLKQ